MPRSCRWGSLSNVRCLLMGSSEGEITGQRRVKPAGIVVMGWLLLGILPLFTKMVGYNFLPSTEWMSRTNLPGLAAGLVSPVLLLWIAKKGMDVTPGSPLRKAIGVVAAPFLGYVLGTNVVVIAGPMMPALIASHQVELPWQRPIAMATSMQLTARSTFAASQTTSGRAWQPVAASSSSAAARIWASLQRICAGSIEVE
ncbi:hypothetical protein ABIA23_005407 [Sinorhizobium fredii]